MSKTDNKKVSKEFIEYLKEAPLNSNVKRAESKLIEGEKTKQYKQKKYYGPVQGDFSKISNSYILENDRLRKKSVEYSKNQIKKQKQNQQVSQKIDQQSFQETSNIQLVKQKAKLEYLQKKGFLKPEQKARLQKLKKIKGDVNVNKEPIKIVTNKPKVQQPTLYEEQVPIYPKNTDPKNFYMKPLNNENFNPNYHMQPFYPGKGNTPYQNYYPGYPAKMNDFPNNQYHTYQQMTQIPQGYENMQIPHQMAYGQNEYEQQNYPSY